MPLWLAAALLLLSLLGISLLNQRFQGFFEPEDFGSRCREP